MRKIAIAVVAALSVGACATIGSGNGNTARATPAAGTQYCWQDRLATQGGKLTCNWASTRREACESAHQYTSLDAARVSKPRKASLCNNGQWLVEVAPAG